MNVAKWKQLKCILISILSSTMAWKNWPLDFILHVLGSRKILMRGEKATMLITVSIFEFILYQKMNIEDLLLVNI